MLERKDILQIELIKQFMDDFSAGAAFFSEK